MSYYNDYCFATKNGVNIPAKIEAYFDPDTTVVNKQFTYRFLYCSKFNTIDNELLMYFNFLVKTDFAAIIRIGEVYEDTEYIGDVSEYEFECSKSLTDCESEYPDVLLMIAIFDGARISGELKTFLKSSHASYPRITIDPRTNAPLKKYTIYHFKTIAFSPYFGVRAEIMDLSTDGACAAIRLYDDGLISEMFGTLDEYNIGYQREVSILETDTTGKCYEHILKDVAPSQLLIEDHSGSMKNFNLKSKDVADAFNSRESLEILYKRKELLEKILRRRLLFLL